MEEPSPPLPPRRNGAIPQAKIQQPDDTPPLPERTHRRHGSVNSAGSSQPLTPQSDQMDVGLSEPHARCDVNIPQKNNLPISNQESESVVLHQRGDGPPLPERHHRSQASPRVERGGTEEPSAYKKQYQRIKGRADVKASMSRLAGTIYEFLLPGSTRTNLVQFACSPVIPILP